MNIGPGKAIRWLLCLICLVGWAGLVMAATPVKRALHATQAEVDIWNARKTSGPYLDGYNRIKARADAFRSSPTGGWSGHAPNACFDGNTDPTPGRSTGDSLRDAGFLFLLTGDTTYRNPVRDLLLTQIADPDTDFTNGTKWCLNHINTDQDFEVTLWLRRLVYGYSYIRSSLTGAQQTSIDTWFRDAANYWDRVVHNSAVTRFPNRYTSPNDFTTNYAFDAGCFDCGLTHFGGYTAASIGYAWNNKAANHAAAVAAIAVSIDPSLSATLKAHTVRYFKEWVTINVFPNGTIWEQQRWLTGTTAQRGWIYPAGTIGGMITIADHLARDGDTSLYDYLTSAGKFDSVGGSKTLLLTMTRNAQMNLNQVQAYACTSSSSPTAGCTTDPDRRIDPDGPTSNYVYDMAFTQANIYYQNALITQDYHRTLPTNPDHGGFDPWGGDWGTLPDARFMWGELEGAIWPYAETVLPKIETLTDNFNATINPAVWTSFSGTGYTQGVTGGRLQIVNSTSVNSYSTLVSVSSYDPTGSCLAVEVPTAGNAASAAASYVWIKYYPVGQVNGGMELGINNGTLYAKRGGTSVGTPIAYSATAHRWVAICEAAGTTTWRYSSNGNTAANTWSTLHSQASLGLTSVVVELGAGAFPGIAGTVEFDNVNLLPVIINPPSNLQASLVASWMVRLTWDAASGGVGGITGYKLYSCSGAGCTPASPVTLGNVLTADVTGLSPSTTYRYQVSALDSTTAESALTTIFGVTTYAEGRVSYWPATLGSGTVLTDQGRGYADGTLNGVTWTTDAKSDGQALLCDTGADYVSVPMLGMNPAKGTLMLWAKPTSFPAVTQYYLGSGSNPNRLQLYHDASSGVLKLGLGTSHTVNTNVATLVAGVWRHLALTWNAGTYTVVIDGTQAATGSYSGLTAIAPTLDFCNVGAEFGHTEGALARVDDMQAYDRALSAAEIAAILAALPGVPLAPSNVRVISP